VSDDDSRNHSAGAPASGPVAPDDGIVSEETGSAVGNRFRALELERHIGERLRFLRRLSGFSQMHVAREIGVSFQQIQKYESGANRVSAALLAEFSNLFHLPMDWFIGPFNTCMERDQTIVFPAYARVMQQLFRGLRDLGEPECQAALDVVCQVARVAPGLPETRLPRLRHVLRDGEPEANAFIIEVVTRLADAHVTAEAPDRGETIGHRIEAAGTTAVRTILMVDDDPDVLRMLSASLTAAGFVVRTARSGDEALAVLSANGRVDAMVTDYAMVGMDGVELLAQADQIRPGLPGIVITGFADATRLRDLPQGVEVLSKPFRRIELVGRLRLLIDGRAGTAASRRHSPALRLIT
jgi:CheY-like chemotaxis protein/transcriptional regulator with XRE-family HTH domain